MSSSEKETIEEKIEMIEDNSEQGIMEHNKRLMSKFAALLNALNIPVEPPKDNSIISMVVYRNRSTSTFVDNGQELLVAHNTKQESVLFDMDVGVKTTHFWVKSGSDFETTFITANENTPEAQLLVVNSSDFKANVILKEFSATKEIKVVGMQHIPTRIVMSKVATMTGATVSIDGTELGVMFTAKMINNKLMSVLVMNEKDVGIGTRHYKYSI